MLIIGMSGKSKSGKDTAADFLVKNSGFVKIALADPIKRMTAIAYPKMTREHLWGSSEMRNQPIEAYPRPHGPWVDIEGKRHCACCNVAFDFYDESQCFLTPRFALQQLGTEWGRTCYENTWVDVMIETSRCLLQRSAILRSLFYSYTPWDGLITSNVPEGPRPKGVVISDVRWPKGNEGQAIREAGGLLIRLQRGKGLEGAAGIHASERELLETPSDYFHYDIDNNALTLEELELYLRRVANCLIAERE